jgi:glyoxylase-like metal-dependent hydrolase (beta-lactamase superfamily II)
VKAFLVQGCLVDSGFPATARELVRFLRARPPAVVVNTHHHEDHAGGDAAVVGAFGVAVLAPAGALPILRDPPPSGWLRRLISGQIRPVEARPLGPRMDLAGLELEVVETPGHSDDHVVFFEPKHRWLFSGDLFIGERIRSVHQGQDMYRSLESLRMAAALEPARLFCAHAGLVEDGAAALRRKAAFLSELGESIRDLSRQGRGPREIRDRLFGGEHWMGHLTRGRFSRLNLVRSFLKGQASAPRGQA